MTRGRETTRGETTRGKRLGAKRLGEEMVWGQNDPDSHLNLNLNSLLVKRQIDNPSPGAVTGGN